jgi:uncharacterized membrane protein YjjP (DUF1212 family)
MSARRRPLRAIFAWPLLLFVAGISGLVLGLTGEGWRDVVAVALLSLPLIALAAAWRNRS